MKKLARDLNKDDKFVAYDLEAKRKALWGGICTVTSVKKNKGKHTTLRSVNARDCNGQKRIFSAGSKWGFLKRT